MVDIDLVKAVSDIVVAFERRKAKYALIGGLAVGLRSRPRSTKDADFIVQVSALSLPSLLEDLTKVGFEIDLIPTIQRWSTDKLIVFYRGRVRIDWIQPITPLYGNVLNSAERKNWEDGTLQVATTEGLILTKLLSFRPQDQVDIESLISANLNLNVDLIHREWAIFASKEPSRTTWLNDALRRLQSIP